MSSAKYACHHPSFNFGRLIYKSFEETKKILNIADQNLALPATKELKRLVEAYSSKNFPSTDAYVNPFIVVEGLDGVGKSTLVENLAKQLGAEMFQTPPEALTEYREVMTKQCPPVCRAYYSLGNYLVAENIKDTLGASAVVLDRFWHSSAAYAIALDAKCGTETNIPPRGDSIYQWPGDLLKPSAVIFLQLSESDRMLRMRGRGEAETSEEIQLKESHLLRQRLIRVYENMENPGCINIDASRSQEEVCENVIKELRNRKILND